MYSNTELALIKSISKTWWALALQNHNPIFLYQSLAELAFIHQLRGPNIEALRQVVIALRNCTVLRGTDEFDELCRF